MERCRKAIEDSIFVIDDNNIKVTISIGITKYKPMITSAEMIEIADRALYESKQSGRNKITKIVRGNYNEDYK